jgi:uncharacterized protein YqgC (DUF456 family)
MELADSALIAVAIILMAIGALLSVVPLMPGPLLVWGVGVIFAVIDGFERLTVPALAAMTVLMIAGSTSEVWMQFFGIRMEGSSCLSTIGSLAGGLVGTFVIPIPILGTVIGMVIGALAFELMRVGELDRALKAGHNTFKLYLVGFAVEFAASAAILGVFVLSVWLTR